MITNAALARLVEQLARESGDNAAAISEAVETIDLLGQAVVAIISELRNAGVMSRQSWTVPPAAELRMACLLCGEVH